MKKHELEQYRKRMLEWRESLLSEVRRKRNEAQELKDAGVADFGDLGLKENLGGFLHLLNDSQREEIMQIDELIANASGIFTIRMCSHHRQTIALLVCKRPFLD